MDDLPAAIERGELRLHFQPQVRLDDGQLRGLEALSRWQHPEHGLMLPGEFIHLAEENSAVMDAVAEWTLGAACAQFAAWRSVGLNAVRISVGAYQGFCFSPAVSAEEAERFLVPCVTAIRLAAVGDG